MSFDYDIQVPVGTELVLKNVNDGDIEVRKTAGDFEVHGVNGGIDMEEVAGSGSVRTVNGSVKVAFSRNPPKATEFRSVNGRLDVYFQPPLDADLSFHRVNGEVFTDFDVTTRPTTAKGENIDGKFVYRADRGSMEVRAGKGGPQFSFDTVNGSIRLHSKGF